MISRKTQIGSIYNLPEFKEFKNYILPVPEEYIECDLESLIHISPSWNIDTIAEGLEYLSEKAKTEKIFYDLGDAKLFNFPTKKKTPFVIICAGGGYNAVASMVEAFPTAKRVNELGYSAFVLHYRTGKHALYPNPIDDLALAVKYVLSNAIPLNIEIDGYAIVGFSAGGHLVSCFGTEKVGYAKYALPKPKALILAYPVITMREYTDKDTRNNFLGANKTYDKSLIEKYSVELNVTEKFPATYIWHCEEDKGVVPTNSINLVKALISKGINVKHRSIKGNAHGWGVGKGTPAQGWLDEAVEFWQNQKKDI